MNLPTMKKLLLAFAAPAISALIGAGIGGYITQDIVTDDTRTRLLTSTYGSYLSEASRAALASESSALTDEQLRRLNLSFAVLMMLASDEVLCRAMIFQSEVEKEKPDGLDEFVDVLMAMRAEVLGEGIGAKFYEGMYEESLSEECEFDLFG